MAGRGVHGPTVQLIRALYARIVADRNADQGATATEYAFLVAFIAMLVIGGVTFFGKGVNGWFDRLGQTVAPYTS